jgi:preprotein translocase subunit SecB
MKPIVSKIKFESFKITQSQFFVESNFHEPSQIEQFEFNLTKNAVLSSDKKSYFLDITIDLTNQDSSLKLFVACRGLFKTDEEIDETYLQENMVQINSPAILFPFIRSFINTLSVNSGYGQMILPAINFAKMANEE